jgi:type VII secretion protein EccB
MPSSKDILEAQRYNRRRLVNAFTSGTPGGREVTAGSPVRPLLAGAALSLVLVLVAVVLGRFNPVLPDGWEDNLLVLVKGTGARYYTVGGVLHPVANVTSARLLADAGAFEPSEVDAATIAGIPRGPAIGIVGAPDLLPAADQLRSGQWTACATGNGRTHTWVARDPDGLAPAQAAVVAAAGEQYLVTQGTRYRLAEGTPIALGLDSSAVHRVDAGWLALLATGADLAPFELPDAGQPAPGLPDSLGNAVIGSVLEVDRAGDTSRYLVTGPRRLTPLSDVAWQLYLMGGGRDLGTPIPAEVADLGDLQVSDSAAVPAWPAAVGAGTGSARACARATAAPPRRWRRCPRRRRPAIPPTPQG